METLLSLFKFLPALISAVKAIEAELPAASWGAQKLQLVLNLVSSVESAGLSSTVITKAASAIVTFFNATGIFTSKPAGVIPVGTGAAGS
jgi:hypothetical protein